MVLLIDQLINGWEEAFVARTPNIVEDRREQIMDAALRVFAQKGFTRATNREIAREAGVTSGLIYHYFDSKDALLKAIIEQRSPLQMVRDLSPQMLAMPPEALLRLIVGQMLAIVEDERFVQLLRVYLPEAMYSPEVSSLGATSIQEATRLLEDYFTAKMESGELRYENTGLSAQLVMGSVMSLVLRRQILHDPAALRYTHEEIVDSIVGIALQGLAPR
jgi:AcrR family transcriptional regulator